MSEVKQISVSRALIELKRFESRINSAITAGMYGVVQRGQGSLAKIANSALTVAETEAAINASFQTVESLIANREAIKAAIVASNAVTEVTFRGRKMTVAAAIEMKSSVATRERFLLQVRHSLQVAKDRVTRDNAALDVETANMLNSMFGADKSKHDAEQVNMIRSTQEKSKESSVVSLKLIESKIANMESLILDIKSDIDFLLTESNSATMISVTL